VGVRLEFNFIDLLFYCCIAVLLLLFRYAKKQYSNTTIQQHNNTAVKQYSNKIVKQCNIIAFKQISLYICNIIAKNSKI